MELRASRIHCSLAVQTVCPECGAVGVVINRQTGLCRLCTERYHLEQERAFNEQLERERTHAEESAEFDEVSGQDQDSADERRFICAHCGAAISRDQLTEANSASIDATIQDMGDDIISALSKDLKKALKRKGWKVK